MSRPSEEALAAALLRLQLSREQPRDRSVLRQSPAETARVAARHVSLVRAVDRLEADGPVDEVLRRHAAEERARIAAVVTLTEQVAVGLERARIAYAFPKAWQHLPDMGHDLDLLVDARPPAVLRALLPALALSPGEASVAHWLAGKRQYVVHSSRTPLEVHHGRLGHFGEHAGFARLALAGASTYRGPAAVREFRPEHQVLLQVLQRMYGHFGFRVSDVIAAARSLASNLDWDLVIRTARQIGVYSALQQYVACVNRILVDHTGVALERVAAPALLQGRNRPVPYMRGMFRLFMADVAPLYARAFVTSVASCRWGASLRFILLPPVAIVSRVPHALGTRASS